MKSAQDDHRKLVDKEYFGAPECYRQEFRDAINKRIVVKGMWPTEALLAGGGSVYRVKADPKVWGEGGYNPLAVMRAQCINPDESRIEIDFLNSWQFSSGEVRKFTVRFEHGFVTEIEEV